MDERKMGTVQTQFAELIWRHEPIGSGELVKLCEREWGWKKPTTYTVLRKLCERGIFQNENSVVTARITREEYYTAQGERLVEDAFDDQCTGANPRYPLLSEIKQMYLKAYYGE